MKIDMGFFDALMKAQPRTVKSLSQKITIGGSTFTTHYLTTSTGLDIS